MGYENVDAGRRNFLKGITTATACSLVPGTMAGQANAASPPRGRQGKYPHISRRILGKTGQPVAVLSHGLMYNVVDNQTILKRALQWGVNHWDTAHMYANGNSELGIGRFLQANPSLRNELFIVSKASYASGADEIENRLQSSLKRMQTRYIDLFYGVHGLSDPDELSNELREWAFDAKKRGLIRYFGFSTHSNMTECLNKAAELDWIDAIMTSYNFRLMQDARLNQALDRCYKKNIGLIAMKIQGKQINSREDRRLTDHFLSSGYSEGQAKLKVVLEDKRFAAVCITMQNVALLVQNVAAALDKVKLSSFDREILKDYAIATEHDYCSGCGTICQQACGVAVNDVMRYLMYHNSYGDRDKAKELFAQFSRRQQKQLLKYDYSEVERCCPNQLPIGALMEEAVRVLG